MDIFDFALKMELDGENYYRELAAQVKHADLKKVLLDLADDEQRHYQIILAAKNQTLSGNPILDTLQNVFAVNREFFLKAEDAIAKLKYEQIDVYQAALDKEQESVKLYRDLQEKSVVDADKAICKQLVHEEEKHVAVLEDIIEMLNHVNDWVESAEFNLKEDRY